MKLPKYFFIKCINIVLFYFMVYLQATLVERNKAMETIKNNILNNL